MTDAYKIPFSAEAILGSVIVTDPIGVRPVAITPAAARASAVRLLEAAKMAELDGPPDNDQFA